MKIGLFFGSFNPVHNGHLIIANHLALYANLDEVWLVVSPQNPFKQSASLLNQNHRYFLIQSAIEGEGKLKVSNIEFKLPTPSYTINTLTYLTEKYPTYEFSVIMGSDSFQNIRNWKNGDIILRNYKILVYKRPGFDIDMSCGNHVELSDAPMIDISSTRIRKMLKEGKSIRYLVPDVVKKEIESYGYYQERSKENT